MVNGGRIGNNRRRGENKSIGLGRSVKNRADLCSGIIDRVV